MSESGSDSQTIVVVDGFSCGAGYADFIRRYGLSPVHVSSEAVRSPQFRAVVEEELASLGENYSAAFDGEAGKAALVESLAPLNPLAVVAGCESGVETADELALALGLDGNSLALSTARRDKFLMQEAVARAGLRSIKSYRTDNFEDLLDWAREHDTWPVIVKPLRSAATEGVSSCRNAQELEKAFRNIIGSGSFMGEVNTEVLVQEQVAGREFAVNTVSSDGNHMLSDMWEYRKVIEPGKPPLYDATCLVRELRDEHLEMQEYTFGVLDALEIRFGPAHVEVMLTSDGPVLIECGARPMGGPFPQDVIEACLGHTQMQLVVESFAKPDAFAERLSIDYAPGEMLLQKCLISTQEGEIDAIPAIFLLSRLKSVHKGDFLHALGAGKVDLTVDLLTRSGTVLLRHEDDSVVEHDYGLIRELENEAQNQLFEMSPGSEEATPDPDWFSKVPDELWLKSEEQSARDGRTIIRALDIRPGETVLDCPCGDGRVGLELALAGAVMTEVDINPRFIERCRDRYREADIEAEIAVSDMRTIRYEGEFDVVVNWFNSFGYFGIEDDFLTLTRLVRALRPGGRILVEAPNREGIAGNVRPKYDEDGNPISFFWDELTERILVHHPIECDGEIKPVVSGARMYSLSQYKLLFRLAGLELYNVLGEDLKPFNDASKRMIMLGRKPHADEAKVRLP